MAITVSTKQPLNTNRMATGMYIDTGTEAAYTFSNLGFKPRYVKVVNLTSGDQEEWFEGMTAGHAHKRLAAGTGAPLTSLGITVSATGFTIGLDTDINKDSEQVHWMCLG